MLCSKYEIFCIGTFMATFSNPHGVVVPCNCIFLSG